MRTALQSHWPEYLIEALGLGTFMVSICLFGTLLWHPSSPASLAITEGVPKRFLMGLAMGLTLMAIVYSPWGKRSGAHINPAFTLTMWQLGQIPTWDAIFYVAAQFAGALAGVWLSTLLLGGMPAVLSYFVTVPGEAGPWVAAAAEFLMCFLLMVVVLAMSSRPRLAPWTGAALGGAHCTVRRCVRALFGHELEPRAYVRLRAARRNLDRRLALLRCTSSGDAVSGETLFGYVPRNYKLQR